MDNTQWIMEKLKNLEKKTDELSDYLKTCYSNERKMSDQEVFIAEKKLDGLGRLTIPKSIRKELDIDENTNLKIYRGENEIIIKKV
jgi:AbrB family looped-hinge helix DNA binding protein